MTDYGAENLINAIIGQACSDYVLATNKLKKKNLTNRYKYEDMKEETENFILHGWAMDYVNIDGEYLIKEMEVIINGERAVKSYKQSKIQRNCKKYKKASKQKGSRA